VLNSQKLLENFKIFSKKKGDISMSLNLKPLADRLVVEPKEREETTPSGLVLPETAKEKPQEGEVLAVGPGRRDDDGNRIAMDVAVGDKVLYAKYGGTEVKIDSKKLLILKESDILAIIE
jgi:chaperonin GroES